ncbi:MAG: GTP pyrophosphokinase [Gammaproteobacteria bacterium]
MSMLAKAIAYAAMAHVNQVDKAGAPYVLHPLRMLLSLTHEHEQMAALLHDTIEDCGVTVAHLETAGFPRAVIDAVLALTRREDESYEDFVRRAARNPIARRVKRADLHDNLDLSRIAAPMPQDYARMEKYRRALHLLDAADEAPSAP